MRADRVNRGPSWLPALAAAAVLGAAPLEAVVVDLNAGPVTVTIPATGEAVTMWGFGLGTAAPTVPGPVLVVPPGDTTLRINLTNNLPEPVSVVIPGQLKAMAPVFFNDATGRRRVRSFDAEAPAGGGTQSYEWTGLKPGTYLYQSGAHAGVQVQMGLHGAAVVRPPVVGEAYPGVPYDREVVLVLSEIDTTLHAAVAAGRYGQPVPNPIPAGLTAADYPSSPVSYSPKYALVNGLPFQANPDGTPVAPITADSAAAPLSAGERILVRLLNAGLRTHVMTLYAPVPETASSAVPAPYLTLFAEDGKPYPYPHRLYDAHLPAGKTADAVFAPAGPGDYTFQDRMLALTNGSAVGDAGLQAVLRIGGVAGAPISSADSYAMTGNTTLTVAAPGVLANDSGTGLSAQVVATTTHGTLALAADGAFTYTPATGFAGTDSFTYQAVNPTPGNTVTVTIAVTLPPVAAADGPYSVAAGATLSVPAPGVLANDTSPSGAPLSATLFTAPASGTLTLLPSGAFTYVAAASGSTPVTFTYRATAGGLSSAPATVTIDITHPAPVAGNDTATTQMNVTAAINVLANDTASGATLVPSSVTIQSPPNRGGSATVNTATGAVSYTPAANYVGSESFTYTVADSLGSTSNVATVNVNVTGTPVLGLSFQPVSVLAGGSSVLRVTMTNTSATPMTGAAFVDTLPANLTLSGTPRSSQCGGTVTRNGAGTQLTFSGGTIPASSGGAPGTCTVAANVVANSVLGIRTNTIPAGGFTWNGGSNPFPATATLTVLGRPTVAKAFSPAAIARNTGTSTLTITLTNPNAGTPLTGAAFTDNLPRVNGNNRVFVATPSNAANTCGGTVTTTVGTAGSASGVRLQGGTIPAAGSCTVSVTVRGSNSQVNPRTYTNTIPAGGVTTANGGTNAASASATLTVQ